MVVKRVGFPPSAKQSQSLRLLDRVQPASLLIAFLIFQGRQVGEPEPKFELELEPSDKREEFKRLVVEQTTFLNTMAFLFQRFPFQSI